MRPLSEQAERAAQFLALHNGAEPLLLPNPWDVGSARVLASLGFQALATTSSGFAASLGRRDGRVSRAEAITHAASVAVATDLPVSADLENGFGDSPEEVAHTIELAIHAGLVGGSIEDFSGGNDQPLYDLDFAAARVAAAVATAHGGPVHFVLTARAENFVRGRPDLDDTIQRLLAYEAAGADVLFAPGLSRSEELAYVLSAISRPLNVLMVPGLPSVSELAALGVSRVSTGGALAFAAYGTLLRSAEEFQGQITSEFVDAARTAGRVMYRALLDDAG